MRRTAFRRFLSLGLLLAALPWPSLAELQVTFFPNKSGASALIQADGEAMLVDAGPETVAQEFAAFLGSLGLEKIDLLAATSAREDRAGGMGVMLQEYGSGSLWMPGAWADAPALSGLRASLQASQTQVTVPAPGETFKLGGATVTALSYPGEAGKGLALRVEYGAHGFLFLPDAGAYADAGVNLKTDVLALGGGDGESVSALLAGGLQPMWAVPGSDAELTAQEALNIATAREVRMAWPGADGLVVFRAEGDVLYARHAAYGITNKGSVNLRRAPSVESERERGLSKGAPVLITGTALGAEGLWYSVQVGSNAGFVRGDLIDEVSLEEFEQRAAQAKDRAREPQSGGGAEEDPGDLPFGCH